MDFYVCDILDMDMDVFGHQTRLKDNRLQMEAAYTYVRVRGGYVRICFKWTILRNYMHRAHAARTASSVRASAHCGRGVPSEGNKGSCHDFQQYGYCNWGQNCRFWHGEQPPGKRRSRGITGDRDEDQYPEKVDQTIDRAGGADWEYTQEGDYVETNGISGGATKGTP
jgi:hypothetical protein